MANGLTGSAQTMIANVLGAGTAAYNTFITAANSSPALASLTNFQAQKYGVNSITFGSGGGGSNSTGPVIILDPILISQSGNIDNFILTLAHEEGH